MRSLVCSMAALAIACSAVRPSKNGVSREAVVRALESGDQVTVDAFTGEFLRGGDVPPRKWLANESLVSPSVFVKVPKAHEVVQLGVERVGEYFLCLLEERYGLSTEDILRTKNEQLARACAEYSCEVCDSLSLRSPLPAEVRSILVDYWSRKGARAGPE